MLAVRSMGLSELKPFDPKEKIIEFKMEPAAKKSLVKMNLRQFCNETLSDSPAPGGGSVAALMGALGRLVRRNGGESFRGETRLGRQARLFQRLGGEGAANKGRIAFPGR